MCRYTARDGVNPFIDDASVNTNYDIMLHNEDLTIAGLYLLTANIMDALIHANVAIILGEYCWFHNMHVYYLPRGIRCRILLTINTPTNIKIAKTPLDSG